MAIRIIPAFYYETNPYSLDCREGLIKKKFVCLSACLYVCLSVCVRSKEFLFCFSKKCYGEVFEAQITNLRSIQLKILLLVQPPVRFEFPEGPLCRTTTFSTWFHAESSDISLNSLKSYSITTHKSQGQTLNNVVIDSKLPNRTDDIAAIYVPLSRVKRSTDLIILRHFDYKSFIDEIKQISTLRNRKTT